MSGRKLDNATYNVTTDWEDETESKDLLQKGHYNIEWSNISATTESVIQAGSSIDIDGVVYVFDSNETPTGSEAAGTNYIRTYDSAGVALVEYTTVAPTYDYDKKGYYSGLKRYILEFEFSGSVYSEKLLMNDNLSLNKALNDSINDMRDQARQYLIQTIETTQTKITASDTQADDYFGQSVAIDNDYVIVGAYAEDAGGSQAGAAYIFHRTAPNDWDSGTKIVASDIQADDRFGGAVSINGDYAIVGAYGEDAGGSGAGAAYIFHRTGTNTWDSGTKIVAANAGAGDQFGSAVSISGDYAIAGAINEDTVATDAGAAYIFHRTGTNTWNAGVKIVANDAQANDHFGSAVSISGDYVVVGADGEDAGGTGAGAAYIFHRTATNIWDAGVKIVAIGAVAGDDFGISVGIDGDYAIAGARDHGTGGAAFIFHRTGTNTWDTGVKIVARDAQASDFFGEAVSIDNDYVIVGAYGEDAGGANAGAAYIFHRTATNTWDSGTKIVASDAAVGDHFGYAVSIGGDYTIVGARVEGTGGAAYMYGIPLNN